MRRGKHWLMEEGIEEKGSRGKDWGKRRRGGVRQKRQGNGRENQGRKGVENKEIFGT